jgi:hypothetical protein
MAHFFPAFGGTNKRFFLFFGGLFFALKERFIFVFLVLAILPARF